MVPKQGSPLFLEREGQGTLSSFPTDFVVLVASPSLGVPICKIRVTVAPQSVPQHCGEVKAIIRVEIVAGEATWELQVPGVSALGNYLSIGEGAGGQGFGNSASGAAMETWPRKGHWVFIRACVNSPRSGQLPQPLSTFCHLLRWWFQVHPLGGIRVGASPEPRQALCWDQEGGWGGGPCSLTSTPHPHPTHWLWIGSCPTFV